jgi:hypothetical protein
LRLRHLLTTALAVLALAALAVLPPPMAGARSNAGPAPRPAYITYTFKLAGVPLAPADPLFVPFTCPGGYQFGGMYTPDKVATFEQARSSGKRGGPAGFLVQLAAPTYAGTPMTVDVSCEPKARG